jgi:hypothetical protein
MPKKGLEKFLEKKIASTVILIVLILAVSFFSIQIPVVKADVGNHHILVAYYRAYIWNDHDQDIWPFTDAGEWCFYLNFNPTQQYSETPEMSVDGPRYVDFYLTVEWYSTSGLGFQILAREYDFSWDEASISNLWNVDIVFPGTVLNDWVLCETRLGDVTHYYKYIVTNGAPTVASVAGDSSGYRGTTYTFTAAASDPEGDSLTYEWKIDGVVQGSIADHVYYEGIATKDAALGAHTISVRAKDALGAYSAWVDKTFTIKTRGLPTGSIVINNGDSFTTSRSVMLTLTYAATQGASVAGIRLTNDGNLDTETWETPVASKTWMLTSGDGWKEVLYQVKDSDGLVGDKYAEDIVLDTTPPTGSIIINSGAASTSSTAVTLSLTYDDAATYVVGVRYSNDGVWDTEAWELPALRPELTKSWTLTSGDGIKTVYYQVKDEAGWVSPTYSDTIVLATPKVAAPTFSPVGGTYTSTQSVTISCATSGATIRYTTDGSEPTSTSTVYSSPIGVSSTTTVKAKAFKSGMADSDTVSATYTILEKVSAPTFTPIGGTYSSPQNIALSSITTGATIRYTTDGSEPTSTSTVYSSSIPVNSGTVTVKAKVFKSGMTDSDTATATYVIMDKVATPTFNPVGGTYSSSQTVAVSCTTSSATIRYTVDGSEPTSSSTAYANPIPVNSGTVSIKAKAFKSGMTDSDTASATYTIAPPGKVAAPTFYPVSGTYSSTQSVTISCATSGATIRYTTDGVTDPTSTVGTVYSGAISVASSMTLKAKAFATGMTDSDAASATYTIMEKVAAPSFNPVGGTYSSTQNVALSCTTPGSSIRYTTDNSVPTSTTGTAYVGAFSVASNITIKAIAYKSGMTDSETASAVYTIIIPGKVAAPTFSFWNAETPVGTDPNHHQFDISVEVTLSCSTSDSSIRYTLDGSEPSLASALYSSPITLSSTTTVKAKAFKSGMTDSDTATDTYGINTKVASPTFSPVGGTYSSTQNVALSCSTSGATIRYTLDSSEPSSTSTLYSAPITISATTTIKAKAFKLGMTDSDSASAICTITTTASPTPTASPVPTAVPTSVPTPKQTTTPTASPTASSQPTATASPSDSPSPSPALATTHPLEAGYNLTIIVAAASAVAIVAITAATIIVLRKTKK